MLHVQNKCFFFVFSEDIFSGHLYKKTFAPFTHNLLLIDIKILGIKNYVCKILYIGLSVFSDLYIIALLLLYYYLVMVNFEILNMCLLFFTNSKTLYLISN